MAVFQIRELIKLHMCTSWVALVILCLKHYALQTFFPLVLHLRLNWLNLFGMKKICRHHLGLRYLFSTLITYKNIMI